MDPIGVGRYQIGGEAPCFIAAEVSLNHNGDLELAKKCVEAAARAGADAVKFQTFRTEDFLFDRTLTYTYVSQGKEVTESQWDMFKRYEPEPSWWPQLKELCDKLGIVFFSTPTSEECVRDLLSVDVQLLKNGSDYLTHVPLLEFMGGTGIPVVVSTGMADTEDVDHAVAAVRRGGRSKVVLLHCTSTYPTKVQDVNLRRMASLSDRYTVPVGFSDHTDGWEAAVQAVSLGACMLERHFTLDRNLPGPDHAFSCTPDELAELVREVRLAETRMGRGDIAPADAEVGVMADYRLSVIAAEDLTEGARLTRERVTFRRPGLGILPKDLEAYVGRRLVQNVAKGTPLKPEHLQAGDV